MFNTKASSMSSLLVCARTGHDVFHHVLCGLLQCSSSTRLQGVCSPGDHEFVAIRVEGPWEEQQPAGLPAALVQKDELRVGRG